MRTWAQGNAIRDYKKTTVLHYIVRLTTFAFFLGCGATLQDHKVSCFALTALSMPHSYCVYRKTMAYLPGQALLE